jgi:hypothetical protein
MRSSLRLVTCSPFSGICSALARSTGASSRAGYDIRETTCARVAAEGKPTSNPVSSFDDVPWYAQYALSYISQFYSNVDYSKLKRGKKGYAQFLERSERKMMKGGFRNLFTGLELDGAPGDEG